MRLCSSFSMSVEEIASSLQRFVSIIHNVGSSNLERRDAQLNLDRCVQEAHESVLMSVCLKLLENSSDGPICHFALGTIGKFVRTRSHTMSEDEWKGLKSGLLALFSGSGNLPFFVSSKLIDVICEVAVRVWPNDWPELLNAAMSANRALSICLFARICDALSEESLSVRCIAPERQLSIRVGLANASEDLCSRLIEHIKTPEGAVVPQLNWAVDLVNGLAIATKQSSHLIKFGMHELVQAAFMNCPDPAVKMGSVDCLSNFIHYLSGQSGRAYTIPRATRSQEQAMLEGILAVCKQLLNRPATDAYMSQEDIRDSIKAFFELLTDIRKTANIFGYFSSLEGLTNVLVETASLHPSVIVQTSALSNLDAMLRTKNIIADRKLFLVCFMACHDFYTVEDVNKAPIPPKPLFTHIDISAVKKRRELFNDEVEEEDTKASEMIGKLKNAALLCVRHIATVGSTTETFCAFLQEILNDTISATTVSPSYQAALLLTEALATTLPVKDPLIGKVGSIVDIVCSTCPPGSEQQYLWFVGKAGGLISADYLQGVFQNILRMDIANNFPAQVAFISLCKTNNNTGNLVGAIHQALSTALGGEMRSWAIGAVLAASAHSGIGSADGYATSVYSDIKQKLEGIVAATDGNVEDFAKRSTPMFATLKAILEVPLSVSVACEIAGEVSSTIIPFCWGKIMRCPTVFEVGQNEYLSILGSQFVQTAQSNPTAFQANACFQLFLVLTQTAGLCFSLISNEQQTSVQSLQGLFDPSWCLRPSLLNILITNIGLPMSRHSPITVMRSIAPAAMITLGKLLETSAHDDFATNSIIRVTSSIVNMLLTALQITTDDDMSSVSDFSGAPKPVLTQRQLKAQMKSRNRFSAIVQEEQVLMAPTNHGPKIPYELVRDPRVTVAVLRDCLCLRTDKAIRRVYQSLPTIITRWWNSVSHDANLAAAFVDVLPDNVLSPITALSHLVRSGDPLTLPGGALHSYTCERAVSGRRLASELVEHSTIAVHSVLSVIWRFSLGGRPGNSVDPLSVVSNNPPLARAIEILLSPGGKPIDSTSVLSLINYAREQSLESRASLKFIVQSWSLQHGAGPENEQHGESAAGNVIRATTKDVVIAAPSNTPTDEENTHSQVNIFG
jgi:hypothetical protein